MYSVKCLGLLDNGTNVGSAIALIESQYITTLEMMTRLRTKEFTLALHRAFFGHRINFHQAFDLFSAKSTTK